MNVLAGCELSGRVRDAFRRRGHNAYSNDILGPDSQEWWLYPTQQFPEFHIVGDLIDVAMQGTPDGEPWDLLIAFPPCTYLARSGLHWNNVRPERLAKTEAALEFVSKILNLRHIPMRCMENPPGAIGGRLRRRDQVIDPTMFGDDHKKTTHLWLDNLPLLRPTEPIKRDRYANQTASGQDREQRSPSRGARRSLISLGIAEAMAAQWGALKGALH